MCIRIGTGDTSHIYFFFFIILPCQCELNISFSLIFRLPDCPAGQTQRVTSNLHSSSSTMAVSRVPSPPLPEVNTPVAENWCYTQVSALVKKQKFGEKWI